MCSAKFKIWSFMTLFCFITLSSPVMAQDVSTEQYVFTTAQKDYELAKADYDAATVMVTEQEQRIAQDEAILKERLTKQATAKQNLEKAQELLDKRQQELNRAWNKERH